MDSSEHSEDHLLAFRSAQVSVLIPMRNAKRYIRSTLKSVLSEQEVAIEVIVVVNNSTDGSRSIADAVAATDSRVKVIENPTGKIAETLNVGLSHALGELVMRCDADDQFTIGRIAQQWRWLQANPEFDAVSGNFSMIGESDEHLVDLNTGSDFAEITDELRGGSARTHLGTFGLRKSLMQQVGGFRGYFETAEDLDFQFRLADIGRIAYVPANWYLYRVHKESVTHTQPNPRRVFFEEKARALTLERQAFGADSLNTITELPPPDTVSQSYAVGAHVHDMLIGSAWQHFRNGQWSKSLAQALRACRARPTSLVAWRTVFVLALKLTGSRL